MRFNLVLLSAAGSRRLSGGFRGGLACAAALLFSLLQASCGGAAGSSDPPPAPVASVSVSASAANVAVNGTVQFSATVQNSSFGVLWQVGTAPGGNSTLGTITASGLYTAPAAVPSPAAVMVSASLQSNANISGSAMLTINLPPPPTVSVSAPVSTVAVNGIVIFTAVVQNPNSNASVAWDVQGIGGGNSTVGTIGPSPPGSLTASYHAPAKVPSPPGVTITARLLSDLTVSGSAGLTITAAAPPPITVTVLPPTVSLPVGGTQQFTAQVQNSSSGVNWQVNGIANGNSSVGTINSSGLFTAPANVPSPATVTISAVLQSDATIFGSAGATVTPLAAFTGIYSWRNDSGLTGQNRQETALTPATVTPGNFGKLFACAVDGYVYAQPLYVPNVTISGAGTHNIIYVATEHDSVYAFDADANPCRPPLWQASFLDPTVGATTVPSTDVGTTDITPEIGITGTPTIDPATGILYVSAETKELSGSSFVYVHRLHALDILTGNEKPGSPAVIRASVTGTGDGASGGQVAFDALTANQRAGLLLAGGNVYLAFASHADLDPYHGWLLAYTYNGSALAQVAAFNTTPNGMRGGMWQSGAPPSADASGNIFAVTSNGTFDLSTPRTDYAETLLKLRVSGSPASFSVADTFTPSNQIVLTANNTPLGSTGALLLPDQTGTHPYVALFGDLTGKLYVANRDNLGGYTPGGPDKILQTLNLPNEITSTPAYSSATAAIYVAAAYDHLKMFSFSSGTLAGSPSSQSAATFPFPGGSPAISSNGASGAVVWILDTSGFAASDPNARRAVLRAYDAANLTNELYDSAQISTDGAGAAVKFTVPTVANGKVYVGTQNEISVYGLH